MLTRRRFLKHIGLGVIGLSCGGCLSRLARSPRHPNVLVILSDDQGWGDFSLNGNSHLDTPHIDGLAREGVMFEHFYVSPVCSPTRAEFLTGRYHPRSGVYSTSSGGERMNLDEKTIAEAFCAAGYATGTFGKWHNGTQYPYHPNGRGFEEFYGFCSGHWGDYFSPMLEHNGRIVQGDGYVVNDFTDKALAFIQKNATAQKPFFAYLAYNTPHSPMQVSERFWKKFEEAPLALPHRYQEREDRQHTRAALAMCENIDWNVGRLLEGLRSLGIEDDTIVLYFSDNGPNGPRWNDGLRGIKGSTDEGGVRSALHIRWPGKIPAGKSVVSIAGVIDLLPTLTDLADIPLPAGHKPLDGITLTPLLLGNEDGWPDRVLFSCWGDRISVRTQGHRLDHEGRLYDMVKDPGQHVDIAEANPALAARLQRYAAEWRQTVLDSRGEDDRAMIVGHPEFPLTQLPARDATPYGGIERSSRAPNCSFFTNWTSVDDYIDWDIEVVAAGEFEVAIYYTCAPEDVGAKIELSFQGHTLRQVITEAHDPPLRGMEHDRVKRIESYVKDFHPLKLGKIYLPRKSGRLVLAALEKPGARVIDFRLLTLNKIS